VASADEEAIEISVGPAGCTIRIEFGRPEEIDMAEYGRTLLLPQFRDEDDRAKQVLGTSIVPCEEGEILTLYLSDRSTLTFACYGDDELRPSIDQSRMT